MNPETPESHIHHTLENIKREYESNPEGPTTNAMLHHSAFLMAKIAEVSSRNATTVEKQTNRLIILTWWIVALTFALLLFPAINMDFLSTFGVDPHKFAIQSIIYLVPAIWATIRVVRNRTGAAVPVWLLLVWFLPLIGAILALIIVRQQNNENRHSQ